MLEYLTPREIAEEALAGRKRGRKSCQDPFCLNNDPDTFYCLLLPFIPLTPFIARVGHQT